VRLNFPEALKKFPRFITDGAILERVRRDSRFTLDPNILHASLVFSAEGRKALANIYNQYIDIAKQISHPIILITPTFRCGFDRAAKSGLDPVQLQHECVSFMKEIRASHSDYEDKIFLSGLIGPKNDAYKAEQAPSSEEAFTHHLPQAKALKEAGVDFLVALTQPTLRESLGLAKAFASLNFPYAQGFVIQKTGKLLDGTELGEAILEIDKSVQRKPEFYILNCSHSSAIDSALTIEANKYPWLGSRLMGVKANTSSKTPEELEGLTYLDTEEPELFGKSVSRLQRFGIRIIGGCCGSSEDHMQELARSLVNS